MYAQLGNIRFEGLKGFTSLEQTYGVNYAQHERINGKPRLQSVGGALDVIAFDMYLHSTFTNPEEDIETLRTAMLTNEILPLILGNGSVVGNFVIPTFSKNTGFTDSLGNLIEVTVSVELLESYSDEPLTQSQREAQNNAFATSSRNANVRTVLPPKPSPAKDISIEIAEMELAGSAVNNYVESSEQNSSSYEYYSRKINDSLDGINGNINNVQSKLSDAQDLQDLATELPDALDAVYTQIQNMKAILPFNDIEDIKIINRQLQGSLLTVRNANVNISNQSIIRRK